MDSNEADNDFFASQFGDRDPNYQVLHQMFRQIYTAQLGRGGPAGLNAMAEQPRVAGFRTKPAPWAAAPLPKIIPYMQTLTLDDLPSCAVLETAAFPEERRRSRETLEYRLETSGSYSLGLFVTVEKSTLTDEVKESLLTLETSLPVQSAFPDRASVLLGHIIATKSFNQTVQQQDLDIPTADTPKDGPQPGHNEFGPNLVIHSFAVLPKYQRMGLGSVLMESYLYRIRGCGVIDRIILVCQADLVAAYKGLDFQFVGESKLAYANGGWQDMAHEIEHLPPGESDFEDDDKDEEEEEDDISESDYPSLRVEMS